MKKINKKEKNIYFLNKGLLLNKKDNNKFLAIPLMICFNNHF